MEFDKSRVYTALNAGELKVGSKCIFADTVKGLKCRIDDGRAMAILTCIGDESSVSRFVANGATLFNLAYLIEPPAEPKYKPFESVEKAMEAIKKHGGWVNDKIGLSYFVTAYDKKQTGRVIYINNWYSLQELPAFFTFTDDGSPCGELVEE
jgi:hypothetical protein